MITFTRVDHISMASADWRPQAERLQRLLGFKYLSNWEGNDHQDFSGSLSQVPGTGIEFEIIAPYGSPSFVQKFLDQGGPGLHHITIEVPDIQRCAEEIKALGLTPFGGIQDDGAWYVTYVHPRESGGILWQLFESHREAREVDRSTPVGGAVGLQRVDHVSLAVPDRDAQVEWQKRVFGFEEISRWTNEAEGYDGCVMRIPGSQLQFEIIAPNRPNSFVQAVLDKRRAGMHHICCEVESVEGAIEGLKREGIEAFGGIVESDWHRHTFLHPRDSGGVLFQLFEE